MQKKASIPNQNLPTIVILKFLKDLGGILGWIKRI